MDLTGCSQQTSSGDYVVTLQCIPGLIQNIINFGFAAAGTVALIFIIISGIKLVRSGGDPKEAEGARQTLTYAVIGLAIVLLSAAILNLVAAVTGVHCITLMGINTCPAPGQ